MTNRNNLCRKISKITTNRNNLCSKIKKTDVDSLKNVLFFVLWLLFNHRKSGIFAKKLKLLRRDRKITSFSFKAYSIRKLIYIIRFLFRLFSLLNIFLTEIWLAAFFRTNRPGNFVFRTRELFLSSFFWHDLGLRSLAFLKLSHLRCCFFSFIIMQMNYVFKNIHYLFLLFCWWHADFRRTGDFQSTMKAQRNKIVCY